MKSKEIEQIAHTFKDLTGTSMIPRATRTLSERGSSMAVTNTLVSCTTAMKQAGGGGLAVHGGKPAYGGDSQESNCWPKSKGTFLPSLRDVVCAALGQALQVWPAPKR